MNKYGLEYNRELRLAYGRKLNNIGLFCIGGVKMARPRNDKKTRKAQQILDENDLYRAIKKHSEVSKYGLTIEEIRSVFLAYADIMYRCLINNIRINMPHIGEFYKQKMKGFRGGFIKIPDNPFQKGTTFHEEYREPKPDYCVMQFEFRKSLRDKFKDETKEDF